LDGVRLIYDAEALYSSRETLRTVLIGEPLTPEKVTEAREAELALAAGADGVICVNEAEATIFRRNLPQSVPVHVLSYCPPVEPVVEGFGERSGFLFVGRLLEKEAPNWQGLSWFVRQCWPVIRHRMPAAKLSVVGQVCTDSEDISGPGIEVCGPVDDLRPVYRSHRVFVAPVRFAAGVPIKVLDAAGAGLPVVGTRLMAEQLSWIPGLEMFADDDPAAFAKAAVCLHEEEPTWTRMQKAAFGRVLHDYNSAGFVQAVASILDGTQTGTRARL
jgi:glycosyltransferase involved in cell wall biosynthesis